MGIIIAGQRTFSLPEGRDFIEASDGAPRSNWRSSGFSLPEGRDFIEARETQREMDTVETGSPFLKEGTSLRLRQGRWRPDRADRVLPS